MRSIRRAFYALLTLPFALTVTSIVCYGLNPELLWSVLYHCFPWVPVSGIGLIGLAMD